MNTSRFLIVLGLILCLVLSPVIALTPANTVRAHPADSPWPMFGQNAQHTHRSPYSGPEIPKLKWSFTTEFWVYSSPAIGVDGTIYFGSDDNKFYAINPDGSQKWNFATTDRIRSSPAIGADGTTYVGSYDGKLYAINPDGSQKWNFTTGSWIHSSPTIGADSTIYVGSYDKHLYAINPDGSQKWSFPTADGVCSSPAIGADGTIYVGCPDGNLYAISSGGGQKWIFTAGGAICSAAAIGADGTIYVGSIDASLYAINPNGSQKWSFPTGDWINSSPAIGADGTIYVGSDDGNLYAVNPNGSQKWSFPTGDSVWSSPAIGADSTIYVGSLDGKLYAINPDGSQKWSFTAGTWAVHSSPAIGADGTIYVGPDYKLCAITEEFDLNISSTAGGSVTAPGVGTFTYDRGTVVNLVAEAEEGYGFVNWTGNVATIADVEDSTTTITMNGDYSITANFEEVPSGCGCFIATAAYGTPMAEEIGILRDFRDGYLLTNPVGQALVDLYYRVSPPMAEFITQHPSLKPVVRTGLLPAVAISAVAVNTSPAEKMAIVGLLMFASVAVAVWAKRRRGRGPEYT